jgi:SAM-dependent methyltransferase
MSETAERAYAKPRGYAGDHLTIEMIYRSQPKGHGCLGAAVDQAFLATPLCKGIRSRSSVLTEVLQRYLGTQKSRPVKITSLGCSSAREILQVFSRLPDLEQVSVTLLDIDPEALKFIQSELDCLGFQKQVRLEHANLVYLALGRHQLDLRNQDLVYSLGLADYFDDRMVVRLLGYMHQILRPSGKVILGSVCPSDVSKTFMDYVINWRLIHRDKEKMSNLFSESAFGCPCTAIHQENDNVSFLAEGTKD